MFMGRPMGGDFVNFYIIGPLLRDYGPDRLYDFKLHYDLYRQAQPEAPPDVMGPFAHAPSLALLLRPLALFSYQWAYCVWLGVTLLVYGAGVLLLRPAELPLAHFRTGVLLALSYVPFLFETWIGGQVSIFAFFGFSAAVFFLRHGKPFQAGVALTLATFKPPLITILGLMLLIGRRWSILAGLSSGVSAMVIATSLILGPAVYLGWKDAMSYFFELATGPASLLRYHKYVDVNSLARLLTGSAPVGRIAGGIAFLSAVVILGRAWWKSRDWPTPARDLLLAATFVWTSVVNLYVPIYDTLSSVVAAALCAGAALKSSHEHWNAFLRWLVLLYITPWISQAAAEFLRIQPFTLVLAGFGAWALQTAYSISRQPLKSEGDEP
jgi:hypothetical protein